MAGKKIGEFVTKKFSGSSLRKALDPACQLLKQWAAQADAAALQRLADDIRSKLAPELEAELAELARDADGRFGFVIAPAELRFAVDVTLDPHADGDRPGADIHLTVTCAHPLAEIERRPPDLLELTNGTNWTATTVVTVSDCGSASRAVFHEESTSAKLATAWKIATTGTQWPVHAQPTDRIALIAISASGDAPNVAYRALVIGTAKGGDATSDGEDWRYAILPLATLLSNQVKSSWSPFGADSGAVPELTDENLTADEATSIKPHSSLDVPAGSPSFVFRDVVQVLFPRAGYLHWQHMPHARSLIDASVLCPVARLETCRARPPAKAEGGGKKSDVGSFVELRTSVGPGAPHASGRLLGFRGMFDVKLALNGHRLKINDEANHGDSFDTRGRVVVERVQTAKYPNLWQPAGSLPVAVERSAQFDKVSLGWTAAPTYGDPNPLQLEHVFDRKQKAPWDLTQIAGYRAGQPDQFVYPEIRRRAQSGVHIPLLYQLGCGDEKARWYVRREFGFRIAALDRGHERLSMPRLVLRFEAHVPGAVAPLMAARSVASIYKHENKGLLGHQTVFFAQEQRIGDVHSEMSLQDEPVRWLITARLNSLALDASDEDKEASASPHVHELADKDDSTIAEKIVGQLDRNAARVHAGLRSVRDAQSLSLMPRFGALKTPQPLGIYVPWHFVGLLTELEPHLRNAPRLQGPASKFRHGMRKATLTTFEPRFINDMWMGASSKKRASMIVTAAFPRLVAETGRIMVATAELSAPTRVSGSAADDVKVTSTPAWQPAISVLDDPRDVMPGVRFRFAVNNVSRAFDANKLGDFLERGEFVTAKDDDLKVTLGAMQFELMRTFKPEEFLDTGGFVLLSALEPSPSPDVLTESVQVTLRLPVAAVRPVQQDATAEELRTELGWTSDSAESNAGKRTALLMEMGSTDAPKDHSFLLTCEEAVTRGRDHVAALSLRAMTREQEDDAASQSESIQPDKQQILVIDPRPFRIAVVEQQPISASVTDESNQVAVWNATGEGGLAWRVRDDRQVVELIAPPQVIGEAMEKYASGGDSPKDIDPGLPAAARFGSHARLRIDPTYADTRFREPGWNLRRILGQAMQRSPGARLRDMRIELLYGLTARVREEDLWLSEIAGAIGVPARPLTDAYDSSQKHLKRHRGLVNRLINVESSRIAADKIWRQRPNDAPQLESGVEFQLRTRLPNALGHGPDTPYRWPVAGHVPVNDTAGLIDADVLSATFDNSQKDALSFPGGVAWAFQSANILMSVFGKPLADGGRMHGLYLTSLGGYGHQRALFDNRRTLIESETTQGRVQRYRLERIGRITCLWHRAKHVIVFERTTVPPAQFYSEEPIGRRQDEHRGRPLLRKVEEFVEILQPVRRYPEDRIAQHHAGFLVGAEFKSKKIRVDSSWGRDVRREGWEVPLWDTSLLEGTAANSERRNPDSPANLYPKPQIRVLMIDESGGEAPVEIDEPQKLHFYTSVVDKDGDDTDRWESVKGVDFCDLPNAVVGDLTMDSEDLHDADLPPALACEPGHERFTLGLASSAKAIKVTYGRTADGPAAVIRNVTIARAGAQSEIPEIADHGRELAALSANFRMATESIGARLVAQLRKLDLPNDPAAREVAVKELLVRLRDQPAVALEQLEQQVDAFKDKYEAVSTKLQLPSVCAPLKARLTTKIDAQIGAAQTRAGQIVKDAGALARLPLQRVDAIAGAFQSELDRSLQLALVLVNTKVKDFNASATDVRQRTFAKWMKEAATAKETIARWRSSLPATIKGVPWLDDLAAEAKAVVSELNSKIEFKTEGLQDELVAGLSQPARDLMAVHTRVTELLTAIAATVDTDLAVLNQAGRNLLSQCDSFLPALRKFVTASANSFLQPVAEDWLHWATKLRAVAGELASVADAALVPAIKTALANFRAATDATFNALSARLTAFSAQMQTALEAGSDNLREHLDATLIGSVADGVASARAALSDFEGAYGQLIASATALLGTTGDVAEELSTKLAAESASTAKLTDEIVEVATALRSECEALALDAEKFVDRLSQVVKGHRENIERKIAETETAASKEIAGLAKQVESAVGGWVNTLAAGCDQLEGAIQSLTKDFKVLENEVKDRIAEYAQDLRKSVEDQLKELNGTAEEFAARIETAAIGAARAGGARLASVTNRAQQAVRDALGEDPADTAKRAIGVYQKGDNVFRALRALGDPPKADRMGFNRPQVAYVLDQAGKLGINMTPTLALVNRTADQVAALQTAGRAVGDMLDTFGVRAPMVEVAEQLIPQQLKDLSVADLLPHMAGIDFKGLLKNVGFPDIDSSKAIKMRPGFDEKSLTSWLDATLDIPFGASPTPLMQFGPVQIYIDTARFTAAARIEEGRDGTVKRMNGEIFGDWRVMCGGQPLMTFKRSALTFDQRGKIDFKIQPDRVDLAPALQFLTKLVQATGKKGDILIGPLMRGSVPSGIAASLDLDLPDIQSGAFGISCLSLHVMFGIAAIPKFELLTELSVGARLAPFTLNVWILNGGGYVVQRMSYLPTAKPKPEMRFDLELAIAAGVGLGFNFGVVSGGVWLQVGCAILIHWASPRGGNSTAVRIFVLARGNVDVAGLITVAIALMLDVTYNGNSMIGSGSMSMTIRISKFYKFRVRQRVTYKFAGGDNKEQDSEYAEAYC